MRDRLLALVALFLVLLYEQMQAIGEWLAPITGVAGVLIALWVVPSQHVLLLAILLAVIALWVEQGWKTRKAI